MPETKIDWISVRVDYEQYGISQKTLALKYGVSQQAISKRARKEHWIVPLVVAPTTLHNLAQPSSVENVETSEQEIVQKALAQLAKFLEDDGLLTLNQHKLFADALSQYVKLKMLTAAGQGEDGSEQTPYDIRTVLARCTDEERAYISAVLHRLTQEDEEKVKPMRRIG